MIVETATVVWGKNYIEDFFNLSLRSLIIEENLSYIKNQKLLINVIFKESEKNLVEPFLKNEKNKLINAIFYSDYFFEGNKYECHSKVIKNLIKNLSKESYIFFFYPDMILSKNFVNNIFNFDKYDLVFLPAPRVQKELFINSFNNGILSNGIDEKTLNNFIVNNLHIKMHLMNLESKYFNGAISWLININKFGMIIKSFHQTPIIIKNKLIDINNIDSKIGIDDFFSQVELSSNFKIIEDSEKISWCSLENEDKNLYIETNVKVKSIFEWISSQTTKHQRENFVNFTSYFANSPENIINLKNIKFSKNYLKIIKLVKYFKIIHFIFKIIKMLKIKI